MSKTELPKYRFSYQGQDEMPAWEEKINALAEVGYRIHSIDITQGIATMSLKSSPNIQNAEDFVNVPIGEDRMKELLATGWIAIANYSKHVTLMRKRDG